MMKIQKVISGALSVMILMFTLTIPVFAQVSGETATWEARRSFIESKLHQYGSTPEVLDEILKQNSFEEASMMVPVQTMSTPGQLSLYQITGYRDKFSGKFLITGHWKWKTTQPDINDSKIGALDGISLAMCQTNGKPVTGYVYASNPTGIAIYDEKGKEYPDAGNASKISQSGIVFTYQDAYTGILAWKRFIGYTGSVWCWLNKAPSQSTIYIKMDYIHTSSSAALKSFGISWPVGSAPTLTMSFDSTPDQFKVANQITLNSWPNL